MADYGEILEFLAANPPQFAAERELHASLLEMLAKCLRRTPWRPRRMRLRTPACKHAAFAGWI